MARILVVEDEPEVRRIFERVLAQVGHEVDTARNGVDAQDLLFQTKEPYDLIISDLLMPRQSGIEFLQAVESEIHWKTPVIIVSGVGYLVEALGALRHGACAIVQKPVDLDELKEAVAHALEHRETYRELKRLREELAAEKARIRVLLRQVKGLRKDRSLDTLTGLPNRARMEDDLAVFREQTLRYRSRFAVAFVDVCAFGRFNKEHGTKVGDRVLHEVARILSTAGRRGDMTYRPDSGEMRTPGEGTQDDLPRAFRFGGDEFVVVLAGQDHAGAALAARRLMQKVAETPIPIDEEGKTVSMAISMGVAVNDPARPRSIKDLLAAADDLLVVARQRSRAGEEALVVEPEDAAA